MNDKTVLETELKKILKYMSINDLFSACDILDLIERISQLNPGQANLIAETRDVIIQYIDREIESDE